MAVLEIIDTLDGVEDTTGFTEVNGKFQREIEVPDVSKLKSALQKERESREKFEREYSRLKDIDPEKYAELLKSHEEGMPEKERYENALKKREAEIKALKDAHENEKKDLTGKLHKFHLDKEARTAALEAGVIPDDIEDVLLLTARNRRLDEKGEIIVTDDDGDPTSQTLKEFYAKTFKEAKPKYFAGIPGGGGAPPNNGKRTGPDMLKLSPTERINAFRGIK